MSCSSPCQKIIFQDRTLFIKRDDLYVCEQLHNEQLQQAFTGNKARKLHYYLQAEFPAVTTLVSYGSAQSNMLYSLSVLARLKGWIFEFYVDHIASHLEMNPCGNYQAALLQGAKIYQVNAVKNQRTAVDVESYVQTHILSGRDDVLYIPEGGHHVDAEQGLKILADEISHWVLDNQIANPKLMLPSGTGTTAFFLQKHLAFEVLTCACVGTDSYLQQQFSELDTKNQCHPTLLPVPKNEGGKRFYFGKLYPAFYSIWQQLYKETEITFDLLYDPLGWLCVMDYLQRCDNDRSKKAVTMIYLHQGGLLGNETMIARYQRMLSESKE